MSTSSGIRTLKIDGKECGASEDQTILEVARENGIYIPTLCNIEGLGSVGAPYATSCRNPTARNCRLISKPRVPKTWPIMRALAFASSNE